jgi:hypothetical protein
MYFLAKYHSFLRNKSYSADFANRDNGQDEKIYAKKYFAKWKCHFHINPTRDSRQWKYSEHRNTLELKVKLTTFVFLALTLSG